jgi:hypothetical protein
VANIFVAALGASSYTFACATPRQTLADWLHGCAVREQLRRPSPASTQPVDSAPHEAPTTRQPTFVCRHCGRPLVIAEVLLRGMTIRGPPTVSAS